MKISICVPMYNESSIIANTAIELHNYMSSHYGDDYEIIFSDDGSRDNSAQIVRSLNLPHVKIVGYNKNCGKGCAVRYAVMASKGEIVLFTDADLAYGLDVIDSAIAILENKECDVLVASRAKHPDGYAGYTPIRKLASKTYLKILNLFVGIKISDAQCGFKGFDGDVGRQLFYLCQTDNFAFDLEVILLAQKAGMRIYEMPATIINHRESKVNLIKDAPKMLKEALLIKKRVKNIEI